MTESWDDGPFGDGDNWLNYGSHQEGRLCVNYMKCLVCLPVARKRILLVQRSLLELRAKKEREKHREQIQRQLAEVYEELGEWMPADKDIEEMGRGK